MKIIYDPQTDSLTLILREMAVIRAIRVLFHDFAFPKSHASNNALTVNIAERNGVAFVGVPAGEGVVSGVGTAPEYCSSRM